MKTFVQLLGYFAVGFLVGYFIVGSILGPFVMHLLH